MDKQTDIAAPGVRVLRWTRTAEKLDKHVSTIRRWACDPDYRHLGFPKPIELGDGSRGFIESEIDAWLMSRPRVGGN